MRCGGTVVLVTGGQQGIGRAIALALAREGADVVLNYLDDPDAAAGVAKEIRETGRRCLPVQGDVSRAGDVAALVDAAEGGVGPVDTLINNAGIFPRSAFLDLTEAEWDRVHGVNLKGSCLTAQAVARRLVARGAPGAIVNLASSAASPTRRSRATATARPKCRRWRARCRWVAWASPRCVQAFRPGRGGTRARHDALRADRPRPRRWPRSVGAPFTHSCCGARTRWSRRPIGPAESDRPRDRCRPSGW